MWKRTPRPCLRMHGADRSGRVHCRYRAGSGSKRDGATRALILFVSKQKTKIIWNLVPSRCGCAWILKIFRRFRIDDFFIFKLKKCNYSGIRRNCCRSDSSRPSPSSWQAYPVNTNSSSHQSPQCSASRPCARKSCVHSFATNALGKTFESFSRNSRKINYSCGSPYRIEYFCIGYAPACPVRHVEWNTLRQLRRENARALELLGILAGCELPLLVPYRKPRLLPVFEGNIHQ